MPRELLSGPNVCEITRDTFPIGQPVIVQCMIDGECGWEFDAPLHFMVPFHRYCITGSSCVEAVDHQLEDMLIDLSVFGKVSADPDCWPYVPSQLKRLWKKALSGRSRCAVYESVVTVRQWDDEKQNPDWTVETRQLFV